MAGGSNGGVSGSEPSRDSQESEAQAFAAPSLLEYFE